MHHTLEIEEILLNIFGYISGPPGYTARSWSTHLAALVKTCRTFKESALDVLWEELDDLSPLARCLPAACYQLRADTVSCLRVFVTGNEYYHCYKQSYGFSSPLTDVEWDILRNYTRRIRSIQDSGGLDQKSIQIFSKPPTSEPLFRNLRHLHCTYGNKTIPLLLLPFPSLISLKVDINGLPLFHGFVERFIQFSPSFRILFVSTCDIGDIESMTVGATVHLPRLPALTRLRLELAIPSDQFDSPQSPLFFPNLHDLTLDSFCLESLTDLLTGIQLHEITNFSVDTRDGCSGEMISSFWDSVHTSGIGRTVKRLSFYQDGMLCEIRSEPNRPVLGLEDLRPCMAFSHLRHLQLDINWSVGLTDSDLLTLTSAWPHLTHLVINDYWGWSTPGGITPNGLAQLLWACPLLHTVALAIDTRGFTELPLSLTDVGSTLGPRFLHINVFCSVIEAVSVPAVVGFFAGFGARALVAFKVWRFEDADAALLEVYKVRWSYVNSQVKGVLDFILGMYAHFHCLMLGGCCAPLH